MQEGKLRSWYLILFLVALLTGCELLSIALRYRRCEASLDVSIESKVMPVQFEFIGALSPWR